MLSVRNVSPGQASNYYAGDDYYTAGEPPGAWLGKGAAELGLAGQVEAVDLKALLHGHLPNGIDLNETSSAIRRAATDLTVSAPKSVSIAALVHGDQRVIDAHRQAVKLAMARVEGLVQARITEAGATRSETTGNAVIAAIEHATSRGGDPQLHTHCLLMNATKRSDGEWRAIENRDILRHQKELDALYKAELSHTLREVGYEIVPTKDGFELAHITAQQIREFSSRSEQIDAWLAERKLSRETASPEQLQAAALATRNAKEEHDRALLKADWERRAEALGIDLRFRPVPDRLPTRGQDKVGAREAIDFAKAHCTERDSLVRLTQLRESAFLAAIGQASTAEVEKELARQVQVGEILIRKASDGRELATTKSALAIETRILSVEAMGRGKVVEITSLEKVERAAADAGLSDEQTAAVATALLGRNRVVGIEGRAGTGKTTTMRVVQGLSEEAGWKLVGLGAQGSAVKALDEAGIQAQTIQSWLPDTNATDGLNNKTLLVIDEAGLVGSLAMATALERAERAGARVLLVGDSMQYAAVEAGRPLAMLAEQGMTKAEIKTMQRQRNAPEVVRDAAQLSADRERTAQAIDLLERTGRLVEIKDDAARRDAIANDYARLPPNERETTLVLTGTRAATRELNQQIREKIGLAGKGEMIQVFERGDHTAAEKKQISAYALGGQVRFERDYDSLGVRKGEVWQIEAVKPDRVVLGKSGETIEFQPAKLSSKGITIGSLEHREMSAGDRVRILANDRELKVQNNERGTVEAIQDGKLRVRMDNGNLVQLDASQKPVALAHGYAATGHSAQGLGANNLLIEKDTNSITTDHRALYTDLTRTTNEVKIYTNSGEILRERTRTAREKGMAHDISQPSRPGAGR